MRTEYRFTVGREQQFNAHHTPAGVITGMRHRVGIAFGIRYSCGDEQIFACARRGNCHVIKLQYGYPLGARIYDIAAHYCICGQTALTISRPGQRYIHRFTRNDVRDGNGIANCIYMRLAGM